jgi:esterase/lipase superfamily enzyme
MNREHHRWYSERLDRDMDVLVFGHAGARVLVFPTRCGRFFDYENWRLVAAHKQAIDAGWLQLYCVDSVDEQSLYADWATPRGRIEYHMAYQEYIIEEVLPLSRSLNDNEFCISHGCSLGAYHAMNIAFRYPQHFGKVIAFSGRYDLCMNVTSFRDLFDGYYDEDIYFNNPSHFVPRLWDNDYIERLRQLEIIFTAGEHDAFLQNNREFSEALRYKGIDHNFQIWGEEAHRARYWREMIPHYF